MRHRYLLPILAVLILAGCKGKYNPTIDNQTGAIVVEGLVTNQKELYKVSISRAVPYDSSLNYGISGASVTIRDNLGDVYQLEENGLGSYYSDSTTFTAVPGRYYTLHIVMPGGDIYESDAQRLTRPPALDSIHGYYRQKEYWFVNPVNQIQTCLIWGADNYMDFSFPQDSIAQFRFTNTLLLCYTYWRFYTATMKRAGIPFPTPEDEIQGPFLIYDWQKFDLNENLNLSLISQSLISNKMSNASACFFPDPNRKYTCYTDNYDEAPYPFTPVTPTIDSLGAPVWNYRDGFKLRGQILSTRVYSLNKASSVFYQQLNAQLAFQGKLFDPVNVQITGNIKCISNPAKLAFGFFETSSCAISNYRVKFNYVSNLATYQPIYNNLSVLPGKGKTNFLPDWWPD